MVWPEVGSSRARTLPVVGRVVGVFPHPDDEAWAAGGTLAAFADAGAHVQVVFATDGEAGADWTGALRSGAGLAAVRRAEAVDASARLGLHKPTFLGLGDGRLDARSDLPARLQAALTPLAPDILLGFGLDGGYPHRDHLALARALASCWENWSGTPQPTLWQTAFAPGVFAPLLRLLRRVPGGASILDPSVADASLGTALHGTRAIALDAAAVARKRAALAAHHSQLRAGDPANLLGKGVVPALLHVEHWCVREPTPAETRSA
ncbi:MAG: hypothetical protein RIT45_177 [Pseudomonadota bacterium]